MKSVIKAKKSRVLAAQGVAINDRRWFLESNAQQTRLRDKRRGNRVVASWYGKFSAPIVQRLARRFRLHAPSMDAAQVATCISALGIARNYGASRDLAPIAEPATLYSAGLDRYLRTIWLAPPAHAAWQRMHRAARSAGLQLEIVSAFRSQRYQIDLLRRKLKRGDTIENILRVSAAPGYSEHHSGRAIDLAEVGAEAMTEAFGATESFRWLQKNAARFGFYLSFPPDNRHGVMYEPWHWCYQRPFKAAWPRNAT